MIADFYNILIGNVKKLVPNFFGKGKCVFHYANLQFLLRLGLKLTKIHCVLKLNQSKILKPNVKLNTKKRIEHKKIVTKMENHCTNYWTILSVVKQWKTWEIDFI